MLICLFFEGIQRNLIISDIIYDSLLANSVLLPDSGLVLCNIVSVLTMVTTSGLQSAMLVHSKTTIQFVELNAWLKIQFVIFCYTNHTINRLIWHLHCCVAWPHSVSFLSIIASLLSKRHNVKYMQSWPQPQPRCFAQSLAPTVYWFTTTHVCFMSKGEKLIKSLQEMTSKFSAGNFL